MAKVKQNITIEPTRKATSQGTGGRGRSVRIATSSMNKCKKTAVKKYRGQGR